MNFEFEPSLQQISAVKIAIRLYHDSNIEAMMADERILPVMSQKFDRARHEHWKLIEQLAMEKLHSLPKLLRTKVVKLLRPMEGNFGKWKRYHSFVENLGANIPSKSFLCWKMDGTIDHEHTAMNIVRNKNVDPKIRFIMACTYFMEEEILYLWNCHKKCVSDLSGNTAVRFWIKYLKEGVNTHWSQIIDEYFRTPNSRRNDYPLRVSSFFRFLSRDTRSYYFQYIGSTNGDDLQCCQRQMRVTERMQLFKSNPSLLTCLLQWPFQIYLIDIANELWNLMHVSNFDYVLRYLLLHCILCGLQDFDYVQLFREFWNLSPDSFKTEIRKRQHFKAIKVVLEYSRETETLPLEELLETYL